MLPVPNTNIVQEMSGLLISAFQKSNILAVLQGQLQQHQQFEDVVTDPSTGYLHLIQLANAAGDTLDKYGKIVNWPRGGLVDDEYRIFIGIKIAVDSSDTTGDALLNILQLGSNGPYAVRDWDNFGYGAALDIQSGYTPFALAYLTLLELARGGGVYTTYRYWTWSPAAAPNHTTSLGLLVLGSTVGSVATATGFKDTVSGTYNNALASVQQV